MSNKMFAVMKKEPAPGVTIAEVDIPKISKDELLLKVKATSICGTDLHIYDWDSWAQRTLKLPLIFGHEVAGEVVEVGRNVKNFKIGDFVSVESHIPCGKCFYCRSGSMHICENLKVIGVDRNGSYAEYVAIPAICAWKQKKSLLPEIASIHEPLGNSVHVVMSTDVKGKVVAIFGCGPTGLFAVGIAKALGAKKVIAIDINRFRLELAKEMKADITLDGADSDIIQKLKKLGGGYGVDIVFEMSGSIPAIKNGFSSLKKGGIFITFGIPSCLVEIDIVNDIIMKEINVKGIYGRLMFKTWENMRKLFLSGKFNPLPVITHRFKLTQFDEAIKTIKSGNVKCGKVVLFP